jgi:predicted nucleic acid-binding protein
MLPAISDASVLVDMADTGLLGPLTKLPYQFVVPDFVFKEITRVEQREIVERLVTTKRLSVLTASADDLRLMEEMLRDQPALSFADCSVVVLAARHSALILTNDSRMRMVSERKHLVCHGTLWIIRQLVQETIVTAERARRALLLLLESNSRLPKADCDRLLRELEQGPG